MRISSVSFTIGAACWLGAGFAAGCGGDSGSNSGDVSTGLASEKQLSDVTPAEAQTACENLAAGLGRRLNPDTLKGAVCTLVALSSSTTPSSCAQVRDACLEEAEQQGTPTMMLLEDSVEFECDGEANISSCGDATVGELEACFNDTLDQLTAALNQFSCADAGTVDAEDVAAFSEGSYEPAASCDGLSCASGSPFGG
jgi:hypothetical protein